MSAEFRVIWQREGLEKRRRIYQTRDGAENYVRVLTGDVLTRKNPDDYACCNGWMCGCGGLTNAEAEDQERERWNDAPKIIFGPVIEQREVGEWTTASAPQGQRP